MRKLGLVTVFSSLLLIISFPNTLVLGGLGLLIFLYPISLLYAVENFSGWRLILLGFLHGILGYSFLGLWLLKVIGVSFLGLSLWQALLISVTLYLMSKGRSLKPFLRYSYYLLTWLLYELAKYYLPIAFPYANLSNALYNFSWLLGIAELGGALFVSMFIWIVGTFLYLGLKDCIEQKRLRGQFLLIGLFLFVSVGCYGWLRNHSFKTKQGTAINIALIQPNRKELFLDLRDDEYNFNILLDESWRAYEKAKEKSQRLDLIIWPETAVVPAVNYFTNPYEDRKRYELTKRVRDFSQNFDGSLLFGNNYIDSDFSVYNAAVLMQRGEIEGRYFKQKLVPFSEYYPWNNLFPKFRYYWESTWGSGFTKGKTSQPIRWVNQSQHYDLGLLICYEDSFPELARRSVSAGADILTVLGNDGWSENPVAAQQHFAASVLRSVEERRDMLRVGETGMTAHIPPTGSTKNSLASQTRDSQITTVILNTENSLTFYNRWGYLFKWLVVFVWCSFICFFIYKGRKNNNFRNIEF